MLAIIGSGNNFFILFFSSSEFMISAVTRIKNQLVKLLRAKDV